MQPTRRGRPRSAALVAALTTLLLTGCAGNSTVYPHGGDAATAGDGQVLRTVLVFVVAPVVVGLLIAALVWLPGMARGTRYRPQYGWTAPPVWFAGPTDPVAALEQTQTADDARGGSGGSW